MPARGGAGVQFAREAACTWDTFAHRHDHAIVDEVEVTVVALDAGEILSTHRIGPDKA